MSETTGRDDAGPREKGRGRVAEGLGWVGRCHFRYSMELCEHVGNTARTGGAIKKMMSEKSRN